MNKIIIYTDGGARNNPGPAGIGVVLYDENKEVLQSTYKELNPVKLLAEIDRKVKLIERTLK